MTEGGALQRKAREKALRLLAVRARSIQELRGKLKEKGFHEEVVAEVIAYLQELKYVDDESFAGQWARNLGVNKLLGDRRITFSLREKGISPALIEKAMANLRGEISEAAAIRKWIKKKAGPQGMASMDERGKGRLAGTLMGKGFPPDLIYDLLYRSKEECVNEGE